MQGRHDHGHDHGPAARDTSAEGIRATKLSLAGLGITAVLQAIIFAFSGSVALLSDTLHNLADALTAIPLWIAFSLGRRQPTRSYTYGFHRAEDAAGLLIVVAIGASAALIVWESIERLADPRSINNVPWVIAAGIVGAAGNEAVARYRILIGRRIHSEALIADGRHARGDAWTSLAVVAAGIGAAAGVVWIDPVAGLVVALVIVRLLVSSGRSMMRRLLDGIEPDVVDRAEETILGTADVRRLPKLRVRWQGHRLHVSAAITVDSGLSVGAGHEIAHRVERSLHEAFPVPVEAEIHVGSEPEPTAD